MKKNIITIICLSTIITMIIFLFLTLPRSDTVKSLSEYFFSQNCSGIDLYSISPNETIHFDYYSITINDYILDKITGIGMVKCCIANAEYEKYSSNIVPYVEDSSLLSERPVSSIESENNVYFYYYFVLNEHGTNQDYCTLHFNLANTTEKFELKFTNTNFSTIQLEDGGTITISPFGCILTNQISLESFDKQIEILNCNDIFSNSYIHKNNENILAVYVFSNVINIDNISCIDDITTY